MRWLVNKKRKPQINDCRIVERFAWFPVRVNHIRNDSSTIYTIWFEDYKQAQIFQCVQYFDHAVLYNKNKWVKLYNYLYE